MTNSEARERVLDAAAKLFAERGYAAVTLRDIAAAVGIRHTSLYHHAPGGKEELFVEVTERHLHQQRSGLEATIQAADPTLRAQLYAAAYWFLTQPPMDLVRMSFADMPAIDATAAIRLSELAFASVITPVEEALEQAQQRGEIHHANLRLLAGGLVGMVQSLHAVPPYAFAEETQPVKSRQEMARILIDVMLRGLLET